MVLLQVYYQVFSYEMVFLKTVLLPVCKLLIVRLAQME